ncbi:MAG: hypothetical protein ACOYOB_18815 [Myxococcota bacterium]
MKRALEALGVEVVPSPGGSSHWLAKKDGETYPIPAGHGVKTEIDDVYLRGVCRALNLVQKDLKAKL